MAIDHLNEKILDKIKERLWIVSSSLEGLGSLFTQVNSDPCFDSDELYGIGNLLKKLGEEVSILDDILSCGKDSTADLRNGVDKKKDESEDEDDQKDLAESKTSSKG